MRRSERKRTTFERRSVKWQQWILASKLARFDSAARQASFGRCCCLRAFLYTLKCVIPPVCTVLVRKDEEIAQEDGSRDGPIFETVLLFVSPF